MAEHLVFVGGGHAHLSSLKQLSRFMKGGKRVTLISPSPYHYYSGMGPGMLSGIYRPSEVRFHIKKLTENQGAAFIQDKVVKIDAAQRLLFLESGKTVHYDVVSFNTGSDVPVESLAKLPQPTIIAVKPVVNLLRARHSILKTLQEGRTMSGVVVGGGPGGIEVSANLWRLFYEHQGKGSVTLIAGKRMLADAPEKVRRLTRESLERRGIRVMEGSYVTSMEQGVVTLNDGRAVDFNIAFVAIGIRPSSIFKDSGLPTGPDGGLLVNEKLQSIAYPNLFGGGDCISLQGHSLAKVGVYAVRENPVLLHNLSAALEGGEMISFIPQKDFLLIFNMGNGRGILWKKQWGWQSTLAFFLKDYIDRRFMKTYQISGEREERSEQPE